MGYDQDLHPTLGDRLLQIKAKCITNTSTSLLWKKVMEAQAKRTWLGNWKEKMNNNIRRIKTRRSIPKRRRRVPRGVAHEGATRATIEKKVRTLKKLIPNGDSAVGLDGLFRETAEYISDLQTRVRIMQAVVDALSNSG